MSEPAAADFDFVNHGSVVILNPRTQEARDWVRDNLDAAALRWGVGVAVEPRYFDTIAEALVANGFTVEG